MLKRQEGKCECRQGDCANSQSAERIKCNGEEKGVYSPKALKSLFTAALLTLGKK
jgi:hypothetical protein